MLHREEGPISLKSENSNWTMSRPRLTALELKKIGGVLLVLIGVQASDLPENTGSYMLRSFVGRFQDVFALKNTKSNFESI